MSHRSFSHAVTRMALLRQGVTFGCVHPQKRCVRGTHPKGRCGYATPRVGARTLYRLLQEPAISVLPSSWRYWGTLSLCPRPLLADVARGERIGDAEEAENALETIWEGQGNRETGTYERDAKRHGGQTVALWRIRD
jgi:hypothetical protein